MSEDEHQNRISLQDNSDGPMSEPENKETTPENPETEAPPKQETSWARKPEEIGDKFGGKIENVLSPVGKPVGSVLGRALEGPGAPIDATAGGIMRTGKAWGEQLGVGFGNHEGGPAKQQEAEGQRMKEPIGGKEQNADNPLGL